VTQLSVRAEYVNGAPPEPVESSTVTLKLPLAVFWVASVTVTVKVKVPGAVGTPVKSPFAFIAMPGGGVPAEMVQLYGGVPPVAVKTSL
jgi:hypothetical protein